MWCFGVWVFFFPSVAALLFFLADLHLFFPLPVVIVLVFPNFKWQQIPVWWLPSQVDQLLQFFHIQFESEKTINGPVLCLLWKKKKTAYEMTASASIVAFQLATYDYLFFFSMQKVHTNHVSPSMGGGI